MTFLRRTRRHRNNPGNRKRKSRKPRLKTIRAALDESTERVVMNLNAEIIEPTNRLAEEIHPSGFVRRDGHKAGTQTNRPDVRHSHQPARLMDLVSLTKPEVLLLVLIATGAG